MKVCIVTDSTNYEPRAELVARHYIQAGHEVLLIESDFDHASKKKIANRTSASKCSPTGIPLEKIYINTSPYNSNISVQRLYYHHDFAKKVCNIFKNREADLLYVMLPGNSLAPAALKIKKKTGARLIFDLIDMWPESLPVKNVSGIPPVRYWKSLRDKYINRADFILTECGLYIDEAGLDPSKTIVMYWHKTAICQDEYNPTVQDDCVRIAYMGSVNNVIDISSIIAILKEIDKIKPVKLDVIGRGERIDEFLKILGREGIDSAYHGAVYDETKKREILSDCEWGLNLMKPGVRVGLTMKSIDYMSFGLKLINNIPGDTHALVEDRHIGVNVDGNDFHEAAERIANFNGASKREVIRVFAENFTETAVMKALTAMDRRLGI